MKIAVVSMRGVASGGGLAAEFDDSGGSIGRANTNLLVLDDPDRTVSRVHAQVLSRNGVFFIIDRGSNPLSHNGRSLGLGNEAPLANGDRLQIGSFELAVSHADSKGKSFIRHSDACDSFAICRSRARTRGCDRSAFGVRSEEFLRIGCAVVDFCRDAIWSRDEA